MAQANGSGDGKIALVTGGGTGVGRGIAEALSAEGYSIVVTGRRPDVLDAAAAESRGEPAVPSARSSAMSAIRIRSRTSSQPSGRNSAGWTCSSTMPARTYPPCLSKR